MMAVLTQEDAMSRKQSLPRPTDGELEILQVLWERGPSTVRQIQEVLDRRKRTGYTTVLKLMQIMAAKGLLARDESQRTHVYRPRVPADKTQRQLVADLMDRVFRGSAQQLVMQALSSKNVSREELSEIRALLDDLERRAHERD
jgi:predicted transcriptional regulator